VLKSVVGTELVDHAKGSAPGHHLHVHRDLLRKVRFYFRATYLEMVSLRGKDLTGSINSLTISPPLWNPMMVELGFTPTQLTNSYATNTGALALGCIIFIPLALKFGRRPVYILSSLFLTLVLLWGALQRNVADLYLSSFFLGLGAATNETLIQLTVGLLWIFVQFGLDPSRELTMMVIGC
jgi:MFS family permease